MRGLDEKERGASKTPRVYLSVIYAFELIQIGRNRRQLLGREMCLVVLDLSLILVLFLIKLFQPPNDR